MQPQRNKKKGQHTRHSQTTKHATRNKLVEKNGPVVESPTIDVLQLSAPDVWTEEAIPALEHSTVVVEPVHFKSEGSIRADMLLYVVGGAFLGALMGSLKVAIAP
ncbi:hypothetical protein FRC17_001532 [Serendipita sp. 399]|nr:hypothetical protein FRC17_001532 [Serendipita sp. 399]